MSKRGGSDVNVRQSKKAARVRAAKRYAAANTPCALCHGARGPIRYDQPRNHMFPLSLAIDEIVPVSRWQEGGYASAKACARDESNWQPTHWVCNAEASDKRRPKRAQKDAPSGTF